MPAGMIPRRGGEMVLKRRKTCPMCHREPLAKGKTFCSAECQFEWEEYDRVMEVKAPREEDRIIYPEERTWEPTSK